MTRKQLSVERLYLGIQRLREYNEFYAENEKAKCNEGNCEIISQNENEVIVLKHRGSFKNEIFKFCYDENGEFTALYRVKNSKEIKCRLKYIKYSELTKRISKYRYALALIGCHGKYIQKISKKIKK